MNHSISTIKKPNESCYVCSLIPHSTNSPTLLIPKLINYTASMCLGYTLGTEASKTDPGTEYVISTKTLASAGNTTKEQNSLFDLIVKCLVDNRGREKDFLIYPNPTKMAV